jgi:hypothetical protein
LANLADIFNHINEINLSIEVLKSPSWMLLEKLQAVLTKLSIRRKRVEEVSNAGGSTLLRWSKVKVKLSLCLTI